MDDSSDSKVEETQNLEGIDQIKETIVKVFDSTNDVQDDGRSISIKEEEFEDESMKMVDLDKPPETIDVAESGGYSVVQDTSLNERIEDVEEASVENTFISDATPGDNMNIESESVVETEKVTEEIQESSIPSSYENDSAAGIDTDDKELASPTRETEELSEQLLIDGNEAASPAATDILETGLEVSNLIHRDDKGEIPQDEEDLGAQETEDTKLQVLDVNKKELSDPSCIELEGNAPVVDSPNDDGNMAKTAEMAENKPDAAIIERKPCFASFLGCCGLSEAFHLSRV